MIHYSLVQLQTALETGPADLTEYSIAILGSSSIDLENFIQHVEVGLANTFKLRSIVKVPRNVRRDPYWSKYISIFSKDVYYHLPKIAVSTCKLLRTEGSFELPSYKQGQQFVQYLISAHNRTILKEVIKKYA